MGERKEDKMSGNEREDFARAMHAWGHLGKSGRSRCFIQAIHSKVYPFLQNESCETHELESPTNRVEYVNLFVLQSYSEKVSHGWPSLVALAYAYCAAANDMVGWQDIRNEKVTRQDGFAQLASAFWLTDGPTVLDILKEIYGSPDGLHLRRIRVHLFFEIVPLLQQLAANHSESVEKLLVQISCLREFNHATPKLKKKVALKFSTVASRCSSVDIARAIVNRSIDLGENQSMLIEAVVDQHGLHGLLMALLEAPVDSSQPGDYKIGILNNISRGRVANICEEDQERIIRWVIEQVAHRSAQPVLVELVNSWTKEVEFSSLVWDLAKAYLPLVNTPLPEWGEFLSQLIGNCQVILPFEEFLPELLQEAKSEFSYSRSVVMARICRYVVLYRMADGHLKKQHLVQRLNSHEIESFSLDDTFNEVVGVIIRDAMGLDAVEKCTVPLQILGEIAHDKLIAELKGKEISQMQFYLLGDVYATPEEIEGFVEHVRFE